MAEPLTYSILVVDNEPEILQSLRRLLHPEFRVHTAQSGFEALEMIRRHAMQVVLSDQRMPDMTGVELLSQVQEESPETMRILFAGYADIKAVIEAVNRGRILRYIAKPWKAEEMQARIRQACAEYRQFTQRQRLLLDLRSHVLEGYTLLQGLREGAYGVLNAAGYTAVGTYTEKGMTLLERVSPALTPRQVKTSETDSKGGHHAMIMRITWGQLNSGTWDEFERVYKETLADKKIDGLRGRWLAQDTANPDGGFAVSLWDSPEALQAYENSAMYRDMYVPTLSPFFSGEYTTYRCEVKYSQ